VLTNETYLGKKPQSDLGERIRLLLGISGVNGDVPNLGAYGT
jgi:hypothetical protein